MARIEKVIDILREKHGVSVRDYLGFGNTGQLKFTAAAYGELYWIGEHDWDNKLRGRGMTIQPRSCF